MFEFDVNYSTICMLHKDWNKHTCTQNASNLDANMLSFVFIPLKVWRSIDIWLQLSLFRFNWPLNFVPFLGENLQKWGNNQWKIWMGLMKMKWQVGRLKYVLYVTQHWTIAYLFVLNMIIKSWSNGERSLHAWWYNWKTFLKRKIWLWADA